MFGTKKREAAAAFSPLPGEDVLGTFEVGNMKAVPTAGKGIEYPGLVMLTVTSKRLIFGGRIALQGAQEYTVPVKSITAVGREGGMAKVLAVQHAGGQVRFLEHERNNPGLLSLLSGLTF